MFCSYRPDYFHYNKTVKLAYNIITSNLYNIIPFYTIQKDYVKETIKVYTNWSKCKGFNVRLN